MPRAPLGLHARIFIALLAGIVAGVGANLVAGDHPVLQKSIAYGVEPVGRLWLNAIIMVVIPLILSTLAMGVAGMGSLGQVGRTGGLTLVCFLTLTVLSTALGLALMNILHPGQGLDPLVRDRLLASYRGQVGGAMGLSGSTLSIELLTKIIPRNPVQAAANGDMLGVIAFALILGLALVHVPREKAEGVTRFLDSLAHVTVGIIELVMKVAPVGVFCLVVSVTARFGLDLVVSLLGYVLTVVGGLAAFQLLVYPVLIALLAGRAPLEFLRRIRLVMVTAFTTSSSNATLPTTMRVAVDELAVPPQVAGFVLPLGATLNMNGTALFEGATVHFLAQVFGVKLALSAQLVVVLMSVVTAIGTAGVPSGSIPLLMMVLGMIGVPPEGIAVVLGVDRLLDMCRTVLNVTGDLVTACVVSRFVKLPEVENPIS